MFGLSYFLFIFWKMIVPNVFGVAQNGRDEVFPLFFGGVAGNRGTRLVRRGLLVVLDQVDHLAGIGAQKCGDEHDDQGADAAADGDSGGHASSVFNVVTPTTILPTHGSSRERARR